MNIAIIGANGKSGSLIAQEAIKRGHTVTAIIRDGSKPVPQGAKVFTKDLFDLTYDDLKTYDVIVDAFAAWTETTYHLHQTSLKHLSDILAGKPNRLLVVGGAGSSYVDAEYKTRLMDTPDFPDAYKPMASNMGIALDALKQRKDVNWTYISPAAEFAIDRKPTGKYKAGNEQMQFNSQGESVISYADYAVAMIDEAEQGKHIQKRFTVSEE